MEAQIALESKAAVSEGKASSLSLLKSMVKSLDLYLKEAEILGHDEETIASFITQSMQVTINTLTKSRGLSDDQVKYLYGFHNIPRVGELMNKIEVDLAKSGITAPWVPKTQKYVTDLGKAAKKNPMVYSMFPIAQKDWDCWTLYCTQEVQFWTTKEMDFAKDKAGFAKLSPRMQQLYKDTLGFLAPGDGLISQSAFRFVQEAKSYVEQAFLFMQLAIEAVHGEGYGRSVDAILPTDTDKREVFEMISKLDCVRAKAQFIEELVESNDSVAERYFAAACSEGVFFVTLFTLIFIFRDAGFMETFTHLNLLISADETIHRDYYGMKAGEFGITQEKAASILVRAINIEIDHLKYILREPIHSVREDAIMGIDVKKFSDFARMLGDQIMVIAGLAPHFRVSVELPHMKDVSLGKRSNFYERRAIGYKRGSLEDAVASGYGVSIVESLPIVISTREVVASSQSHLHDPAAFYF